MTHHSHRIIRLLGGLALVLLAVLTLNPAPLAADPECSTQSGQARECTASEAMLTCFDNGIDAYDQCRSGGSGFFNWVACSVGWEIDFYSCFAVAPVAVLLN